VVTQAHVVPDYTASTGRYRVRQVYRPSCLCEQDYSLVMPPIFYLPWPCPATPFSTLGTRRTRAQNKTNPSTTLTAGRAGAARWPSHNPEPLPPAPPLPRPTGQISAHARRRNSPALLPPCGVHHQCRPWPPRRGRAARWGGRGHERDLQWPEQARRRGVRQAHAVASSAASCRVLERQHAATCAPAPVSQAGTHMETLTIYHLSSIQFTTPDDLFGEYGSQRVVIETKLINHVFSHQYLFLPFGGHRTEKNRGVGHCVKRDRCKTGVVEGGSAPCGWRTFGLWCFSTLA